MQDYITTIDLVPLYVYNRIRPFTLTTKDYISVIIKPIRMYMGYGLPDHE